MKAISVRQPWASMIEQRKKTIETRTWQTEYRGDLLIVSSKKPKIKDLPTGKALCVVRLIGCRLMTKEDEKPACCEVYPGAYAWLLEDIRPVEYVDIHGSLKIYEVDERLITADCLNCLGRAGGCNADGSCIF